MTQLERCFRLTNEPGAGVCCSEMGLFVGEVSVLERTSGPNNVRQWRPRPLPHINRELSRCYGLPVELDRKIAGLTAVARALDREDFAHAQIATLHLCFPNPPELTKSAPSRNDIIDLAHQLHASDMLKVEWDPEKHPRWPAESPDGIGGRFAPADGAGISTSRDQGASFIPVQITIPAPLDIPVPGLTPFPSEIVVPPIVTPNMNPREAPANPYPDRPECVEEWAEAEKYCRQLLNDRKMGKHGFRGMGLTYSQCLRGQVSESCGGSPIA